MLDLDQFTKLSLLIENCVIAHAFRCHYDQQSPGDNKTKCDQFVCENDLLTLTVQRSTVNIPPEAVMIQCNSKDCLKSVTECAASDERNTVFLLCSLDTVAVEASWVGRGTARRCHHHGKKSTAMGGFPRQEQVSLQWEDHDGSTDGNFLPDLYPDYRHQWLILWFRVSAFL